MQFRSYPLLLFLGASSQLQNVRGFTPSSLAVAARQLETRRHRTMPLIVLHSTPEEKGPMDIISMKVNIPEEVRDEIFKAEANTPAAKDRNQRIALYATLAFLGIALSSLNVFLTTIRSDAGAAVGDLSAIEDLGFGWVSGNPFTSFFLLNGIGGGIALIAAGFGGTMVELEQRTKIENAEKIWKEFERRKNESEGGGTKKKKVRAAPAKNKKKRKNKNRKRLSALSEVIMEEEPYTEPTVKGEDVNANVDVNVNASNDNSDENKEAAGFMGKMKDFYKKADDMAASQALLLNKELEDKGIVDKITDESGLKVIGKEAASKLKDQKDD